MCLQMIDSMISSAPQPMEHSRVSPGSTYP